MVHECVSGQIAPGRRGGSLREGIFLCLLGWDSDGGGGYVINGLCDS